MHVYREDDLVLVAEVHQRAEGQALGRRELHGAGGDACRQRPGETRRLAGVACIEPVDMPVGLELEVQAGREALAGRELRGGD